MKRVLLTGVSGFIGANCLKYFLQNTDWEILGLASYTHKGQVSRLEEIKKDCEDQWSRVKIYRHDLTAPIDKQLENLLLNRKIDDRGVVCSESIDYIFNFASDSAVERSIANPEYIWNNNCKLIMTMLEFARRLNGLKLFIQVSTDEVYGECVADPHKEWDTIIPNNAYAASKAAQEALCTAYWRSYSLPIIITNCANVVGPLQDSEKFLPKIIQSVSTGKEIPIYGDLIGDRWNIGSRIYLDVRNKADALIHLTKYAPSMYEDNWIRPDKYNITGYDEVDNLEMAQMIASIMEKELKYKIVESESARPGYDRRYALDGTKMKLSGWTPPYDLKESLRDIVEWTTNNQHWLI